MYTILKSALNRTYISRRSSAIVRFCLLVPVRMKPTGFLTVLAVRIGVRLGDPGSHRLSYPYFLRLFTSCIGSGRNNTKPKEYNTIS